MDPTIISRAQCLLANAAQCHSNDDFGSVSLSIYDTAWLAMLRRNGGKEVDWLFPESFEFILKCQLPSGRWSSHSTLVNDVLNTAAALLALRKHLRTNPGNIDWIERSTRGEKALGGMLDALDIDDIAGQSELGILIVKHVELIQDEGISFYPRILKALRSIRDKEFAKAPPTSVYGAPFKLHRSLEAFIGYIDFDKVRDGRQPNGSMMLSPSSTASYLMYAASWDDVAEKYLKDVLKYGSGRGNGSVPSMWPSSLFEVSWVVATLLEVNIAVPDDHVGMIGTYLQQALESGKGTVGFAHGPFHDVDSTAKAIIALYSLGYCPTIEGLLEAFETEKGPTPRPNEQSPGFTTHCHILIALLKIQNPGRYSSRIQEVTIYLTSRVFAGDWGDSRNRSDYYSIMLLLKAYELLYRHADLARQLFEISPNLEDRIPIIALHCLSKLLLQQNGSGSWGETCEVTSYAILSLASLLSLPWMRRPEITSIVAAAARGKVFLHGQRDQWSRGHPIWIGKVDYASDVLSEAYCLAAALVLVDLTPSEHARTLEDSFVLREDILHQIQKAGYLLFRTPLLSNVTKEVQSVLEVQAGYYLRLLRKTPVSIFPEVSKDKRGYQIVIPLAFTACMAINDAYGSLNLDLLQEMMVLSNLNFLVDDYMEGVIDKDLLNHKAVKSLIENLDFLSEGAQWMNGNTTYDITERIDPTQDDVLPNIFATLTRFIGFVLNHVAVQASPESYRDRLAFELKACILAHVTQAEDNHEFMRQYRPTMSEVPVQSSGSDMTNKVAIPHNTRQYTRPGRSFYNWVRGTSANHTSCPFSFVFFNSLMYSASIYHKADLFRMPRVAYVAEDLCRHLASMCRMYNDYGSLQRDMKEMNLNSTNFPEFSPLTDDGTTQGDMSHAKSELLWIAEYERQGIEASLALLGKEFTKESQRYIVDGLRFFINITDLFGQIYVLKDVGISKK